MEISRIKQETENFNVDVLTSQSDMLDVAMSNSVKFNGCYNRLTPESRTCTWLTNRIVIKKLVFIIVCQLFFH